MAFPFSAGSFPAEATFLLPPPFRPPWRNPPVRLTVAGLSSESTDPGLAPAGLKPSGLSDRPVLSASSFGAAQMAKQRIHLFLCFQGLVAAPSRLQRDWFRISNGFPEYGISHHHLLLEIIRKFFPYFCIPVC